MSSRQTPPAGCAGHRESSTNERFPTRLRLREFRASEANAADSGQSDEDPGEVVLYEERVVVQKEQVPVERVSLGAETVSQEQQQGEVRRKRIDVEEWSAGSAT